MRSTNLYESLAAAEQVASERFNLTVRDWVQIDDPIPGAARTTGFTRRAVKRDQAGNSLRGQFEPIPQTERWVDTAVDYRPGDRR